MYRFNSLLLRYATLAAATALVLLSGAQRSAEAVPRWAATILIWKVPAPQAADPSVAAAEAGFEALNVLGPQLLALANHRDAKLTFALDPAFVRALGDASAGHSAVADLAAGKLPSDGALAKQLLVTIAGAVYPSSTQLQTRAAKRFMLQSAAIAARSLRNEPLLGSADAAHYAAVAIALSLRTANFSTGSQDLLQRQALSANDMRTLAGLFAQAVAAAADELRAAARTGSVELAALPAYEPIMPLVIDAAGRSERVPFTVTLNAAADVGAAVDQGLAGVRMLDPGANAGVVSPSGAYDDLTAALLQQHRARYGVFSERVVKANVGAAADAVADAHSAAFRAYQLETSKTQQLPVFFCADAASSAIVAQAPQAPASAMADRLAAAARTAVDAAPDQRPPLLVLCLPATGAVLRLPNRVAALDDLAAALAHDSNLRAFTPSRFLSQYPPTSATYGYEAASDLGGFNLWMGSQQQMSMWNALAGARAAAGSDDALRNARVRDPLLQAESGRWFMALALPQPRQLVAASLQQFRDLLAAVYRGAGKTVPANLAPVNLQTLPVSQRSPGP